MSGQAHPPRPADVAVSVARQEHAARWRMSGDESVGDRLAAEIKTAWLAVVSSSSPGRYALDVPVGGGLRERLALHDRETRTAYEIKPSPNNVHFHFYRQIFKILLARENGMDIRRFVLLCPNKAQAQLSVGMGAAVVRYAATLGLDIEVVAL